MSETKAIELVHIIFDYLKKLDHSCLYPFIANWPSKPFQTRNVPRHQLPVLSYLPQIEINKDDIGEVVVNSLKACATYLRWGQTYTAEDFGEAFLEKYGWTELIGLRGPIASYDIACGFLLLGPNIEYPKHSHEAVEVYVPFNSQTLWIQGKEDWASGQCNVPFYHKPWFVHAMQTGSSPLLALYLWRGENLVEKPQIHV